ncbi:MAG: helix-turn-helix transcriptional regulator [Eubacteriaceae bacterium]|nr:helix-turn-helix transcriptional regulator [Eubacteriaceae bacterium]
MKLSDKIIKLRKVNGLSQEELAEKLNVSRQAVSRWEVGSALPDALNILQLSKLFNVTADFLLNDEYESDDDIPVIKAEKKHSKQKMQKLWGVVTGLTGLLGNFIFYIMSRFIDVMVPIVTYNKESGQKLYTYSSGHTDYSYIYFIKEHNLEFLTAMFWLMVIMGIGMYFINKEDFKSLMKKLWK